MDAHYVSCVFIPFPHVSYFAAIIGAGTPQPMVEAFSVRPGVLLYYDSSCVLTPLDLAGRAKMALWCMKEAKFWQIESQR